MCLFMVSPSAPTNNQDIDLEARRDVPPTLGNGPNGIPAERGHAIDTPRVNRGYADSSTNTEPRMIGDFDSASGELWALYGKEAKSHDEARIQTLKEDMDGVLIFAGLFSAALTAFIIDSKQNLEANSEDQMVYYLQQNVAILDQISRQISSIAPQFPIPSAPPAPFPTFIPLASDIRVNVFWFISLIFSLSAALLAILVRQWVRKYMQVLQRYDDPLKSARIRQYLNEGLEGWYMPVVAEAIPCVLHVSLFLFFAGLSDFVLNINATVGLSTAFPIVITSFLYIFTTIAPVIYPQSPYQTSLSVLLWYLIQNIGSSRYRYRDSEGISRPVSQNMAQGQLQLAMEETLDRKRRDERAIRWLVSNMTGDVETDSLVMAAHGSFDTEWGGQVWEAVGVAIEDKDESGIRNEISCLRSVWGSITHQHATRTASHSRENTATLPHTRNQADEIVRPLSAGVTRMLGTCLDRSRFPTYEQWRRRARGSVETAAWLVCVTGAEFGQAGDIVEVLGNIGRDQTVRESSLAGKEQSFVMHWTCLSLMAIRPILKSDRSLHEYATLASQQLGQRDNSRERQTRAEKIMETLNRALRCLKSLSDAVIWEGALTEERVREIFRDQESQILQLEQIIIDIENGGFELDHRSISAVIDQITHQVIIRHLPGVKSDLYDSESVDFSQFVELFCDPHALLFTPPLQNLKNLCSFARTIRHHLEGQWDINASQEIIKNLRECGSLLEQRDNPFQRQVWRLQDLSSGGGLGFTVELFFLALNQLLSTPSSKGSHPMLYRGTLRAITSDWSEYKNSLGTQQLVLNMVVPQGGLLFDFNYPTYIVDEFLAFLGSILEGQVGPHIDEVIQRLTAVQTYSQHHALSSKVLAVIRARASSS